MWWHWPRSKMVPIISNFECMPIESMATIKLTCDTWFRYCTIDRQILWYSSQQTQYKRSKCPIDRLSKNHQRSLWNDKWGSLINSMTLSMYTNTLVAGCSQSSAFSESINQFVSSWLLSKFVSITMFLHSEWCQPTEDRWAFFKRQFHRYWIR